LTAKPTLAAIALGSNLGNREANLRAAMESMRSLGEVKRISTFHDTAPVGYLDQPRFLNAAVLLRTTLPPQELLQALLAIEQQMGRNRATAVPKGPRVIDLDILLYGDAVLDTPTLVLPHPQMHERAFVLKPLAEIAPGMMHPLLFCTVDQMLADL
jgi:2-amino-4-hydroxy-6-hydroxymethyldihydropteridine diphosphokinase